MEKEKLNWKRLLITIGIVLLTAATVGGGTWYVMDQQAKKDAEEYQKELESPGKKQEEIENKNNTQAGTSANAQLQKSIRDFDLKKLTAENGPGSFQPIRYGDLTRDGKEDALVVFAHEGTGGIKDFFVYSLVNSQPKLLFSKRGLNYGQISLTTIKKEDGLVVGATWVDPQDPANIDKSNVDMVVTSNTSKQYRWDGIKFAESYMQ